ncbi:MAG: hypothetical protein ACFFD1_00495 [Candidatus Thorarchaeota archaeon]
MKDSVLLSSEYDVNAEEQSNWIWDYWKGSSNKVYYALYAFSIIYSLFIVFPFVRLFIEGGMDSVTFSIGIFIFLIIVPLLVASSPRYYHFFKKKL